jgi:predicted DCC family thiol-disulfide oxidoreductase YuxK
MKETDHPIILFDGVCNFCNKWVSFLIKQDKKKIFRFAALQSAAGQRLQQKYNLPVGTMDSFIFIEKDKAYLASTAGLQLNKHLPMYWRWMQVFWIVPKFIRDKVYSIIARNRYKLFGKKDTCMIPTPELRSRFLN